MSENGGTLVDNKEQLNTAAVLGSSGGNSVFKEGKPFSISLEAAE